MCATQLVTSKTEKITMKKNKGLYVNIILEYTNMIMLKVNPAKDRDAIYRLVRNAINTSSVLFPHPSPLLIRSSRM